MVHRPHAPPLRVGRCPPRGPQAALGRPGAGLLAPTLPHCVWVAAPRGCRRPPWGGPAPASSPPRSPTACGSLPPEGAAGRLGAARRRPPRPHAPPLRVGRCPPRLPCCDNPTP